MSIKKKEGIAEALRQDNIELQTSGRIMAENLEILRCKMAEIHRIASTKKSQIDSMEDHVDSIGALEGIIKLAEPIEA